MCLQLSAITFPAKYSDQVKDLQNIKKNSAWCWNDNGSPLKVHSQKPLRIVVRFSLSYLQYILRRQKPRDNRLDRHCATFARNSNTSSSANTFVNPCRRLLSLFLRTPACTVSQRSQSGNELTRNWVRSLQNNRQFCLLLLGTMAGSMEWGLGGA